MNPTVIPELKLPDLDFFIERFSYAFDKLPEGFLGPISWILDINVKLISNIIILIFAVGIGYVIYKIINMRKKRLVSYVDFFAEEGDHEIRTEKWQKIKSYMESNSPNDWKMAIIEADSLIDEIMSKIGYSGKDLGARLKSIEPSDFDNLQNVWEAHKVRNRIAHEGSKFDLPKSEAKVAIGKYERALKELKYI